MSRIRTTNKYWDCECDNDYIRKREETECHKCEAKRWEQPDSRINEVIKAGLPIKNEGGGISIQPRRR